MTHGLFLVDSQLFIILLCQYSLQMFLIQMKFLKRNQKQKGNEEMKLLLVILIRLLE